MLVSTIVANKPQNKKVAGRPFSADNIKNKLWG